MAHTKTEPLIEMYCHCPDCIREDSPPNIAVGVIRGGTHLQVWCETHELSLGLFALRTPLRQMVCSMCEREEPHVH
jgi:hypothetical protein